MSQHSSAEVRERQVGGTARAAALLRDHPQRQVLNDEVHARPPEPLAAPLRASYVALLGDAAAREGALDAVRDLARRFGAAALPEPGATHYSAHLGAFRLRWERHGVFSRCMVVALGLGEDPFAEPAIAAVSADCSKRCRARWSRRSTPPSCRAATRRRATWMRFRRTTSPATSSSARGS